LLIERSRNEQCKQSLASTSLRERDDMLVENNPLLIERSRNEQCKQSLASPSLSERDNMLVERSRDEQSPDTINLPFVLDELPEGWKIKKINQVKNEIKYGYTAKAQASGNVKYLRITDIQDKIVNWEKVPYCEINPNKVKDFLLKKGDIVVARTGSTGKSFLINECPLSVFASYLIRIRFNEELILNEYAYLYFQTDLYWKQILEKITGTIQPNCNATKLSNIVITLPTKPEQEEIVRRVEKLFAIADKIEEHYKKAMERVEKLEQAILAKAFRGELAEPDPNDEPAEILLQKILQEKNLKNKQK
ncbi:MAG: restriction endonuclease subunit S, partial [Bacteroidales bacterium]|nr:restriction endonuclease subunit S [Bacteroidales bacterium]